VFNIFYHELDFLPGYGIGTPRDSPYRDLVTSAILKLQEEQILPHLYNTWWKEKQGGGCGEKEKSKKDKASALGMANVGGVFLVRISVLARISRGIH
jgi:ionotropic glutamate receptor